MLFLAKTITWNPHALYIQKHHWSLLTQTICKKNGNMELAGSTVCVYLSLRLNTNNQIILVHRFAHTAK